MAGAAQVIELGRAERNKREKRERLIRAARELFRTKGFAATTTSEIAELADVAKGTLFFHAGSKEELLVMMFQEDMGRTIERAFAMIKGETFYDQMMYVFRAMIDQNRRDLELARIFVKELPFVKGDRHGVAATAQDFFDKMSLLIEEAKKRGEIIKDVDSRLLAHNLFALHYVFTLLWLGSGEISPEGRSPSMGEILALELKGFMKSPDRQRATGKTSKTRNQARS
ncbi:MAG TPA: TetR/AcrR family transcriptional regulator [Candidatus Binataceae bacterium]|nr:TetR/AcrR family transcriptional regulator [Candidatus Binataceae bacterium]